MDCYDKEDDLFFDILQDYYKNNKILKYNELFNKFNSCIILLELEQGYESEFTIECKQLIKELTT